MAFEDFSNTSLTLGSISIEDPQKQHKKKPLSLKFDHVIPSLTLGLSSEDKIQVGIEGESTVSVASSHSLSSMKRERDGSGEEMEEERVFSKVSDHGRDDEGSARKKLKLTKEQSNILEERFKQNSTLNPKQKQTLAKRLNLRPRQLEIWFQNRRARTKLKQAEVECELLKKYCETLSDENRRLKKEVKELKTMKLMGPFYMQMPAAALTVCPSCQRISGENASKNVFSVGTNPHFYSPFAPAC